MNLDEAVVLRTYACEAEASIAESRLGFEGIETRIQKDDCGGAYPSLQMAGGVRLLVKPEDLEDAERILSEMKASECEGVERQAEQADRRERRPSRKPLEAQAMKDPPSRQLDELKTVIFTYVVMAPLLSALFADKIDNVFVACLLFVGLVGMSFVFLKRRLEKLDEAIKEQERRLMELEAVKHEELE